MSIWDYRELKQNVDSDGKLVTLQEGKTPIQTIKIDNFQLIIKREDKNPTGSWKDRLTAYKLTKFLDKDIHEGVIFTSGNTAISYLTYIQKLQLPFKLHVVVSDNINEDKLNVIKKLSNTSNSKIYIEENPKLKSVQLSAQLKIPNLKASIDDEAVESYWSLGFELASLLNKQESNKDIGIFVPTSSGTGFIGLSQGIFIKLSNEFLLPKLFACQTTKVHPFFNHLKSVEEPTSDSLADAIIDTSGLRSPQVLKIVKETEGDILIVNNETLREAKELVEENNIRDLSFNSLLSIGGALQSMRENNFKKVICIASGK